MYFYSIGTDEVGDDDYDYDYFGEDGDNDYLDYVDDLVPQEGKYVKLHHYCHSFSIFTPNQVYKL